MFYYVSLDLTLDFHFGTIKIAWKIEIRNIFSLKLVVLHNYTFFYIHIYTFILLQWVVRF